MLPHTPDTGVDLHRFLLHPLACVGPVVIGDAVPIIPVDTPPRDRRTDDILGQGARQTLLPCRDLAFWHIAHTPLTIARITRIHQPPHLRRLDRLASHRQQMPLPLFPQQALRDIVEMAPLLGRGIPPAPGRNDMEMRVVLPMAAMPLHHDDGAPLEGRATDPAEDIIQAPHPTPHAWAQEYF